MILPAVGGGGGGGEWRGEYVGFEVEVSCGRLTFVSSRGEGRGGMYDLRHRRINLSIWVQLTRLPWTSDTHRLLL